MVPSPPPSARITSVPLVVGSFPFTSSLLNLASGIVAPVDPAIAAVCPEGFGTMLTSGRRKNIWKLTGMPTVGTLGVNNCAMPTKWDSVSILLAYSQSSNSFTCTVNDDGCAYSGGDRVAGVALAPGTDYFYIVLPYQAYVGAGAYQLQMTGPPPAARPPPALPPAAGAPPPPASAPVPAPAPAPAPVLEPAPAPISVPAPISGPALAPTVAPDPAQIPSTALDIPSVNYLSDTFDLSSGTNARLAANFISECPLNFRNPLNSTAYVKNIWKLKGLPSTPGSMTLDNCNMATRWDSISAVLACPIGSTTCRCITNDDG